MKKVGLAASAFDLCHAGHCLMLKDAKTQCDYLVAALHSDPSIDRPSTKNEPVMSLAERKIILESNKYVDEILVYDTEEDLEELIRKVKPDVRILGSDWEGKKFTGEKYSKTTYFHERDHDWSSSGLRYKIYKLFRDHELAKAHWVSGGYELIDDDKQD